MLCVDNDEGGIEAVDRLRDILADNGYSDVKRLAPEYKDWNEVLKAKNGATALPAVPHKRKEEYLHQIDGLKVFTMPSRQADLANICNIQKRTIQVSRRVCVGRLGFFHAQNRADKQRV